MISSLDLVNSRYVQGGTTEQFSNRLGFWERKIFPRDVTDRLITLEAKYHRRPDLLAYDLYKDSRLMWFILQYNTIVDIDVEFVAGKTLLVPTPYRLRVGLLSRGV